MGWAIVGLTLLLYLLTLSRHYSADSVIYALQIESGQLGQILDPTHLLLQPVAYGWYRLWQGLGWQGESLFPLQVLNALAGAVSVGILYAIGRRLTGSTAIGAVVAAGFAVSGGLWLLSVEAEFVTVPLISALLVLWLVLAPPQRLTARPSAYACVLGGMIGLAIFFYLNSALLILVAAVGLVVRDGRIWREQIRQLAIMMLVVTLVCVPAALYFVVVHDSSAWTNLIWQDSGAGYTSFSWLDAPHGAYAFLRTLGLYPGQALNDSTRVFLRAADWGDRATFAGYYAVVLLIALAPIYLAIRVRRSLCLKHHRAVVVLSIWSVLYAGFAIYWVPGDISFWVPVLAAWWLLIAMLLAVAAGGRDEPTSTDSRRSLPTRSMTAVIILTMVLAAVNVGAAIWPRHDLATNSDYWLAKAIQNQTWEEDLIVTKGDEIISLYVVYFGRRTVLPVVSSSNEPNTNLEQYAGLFEETRTDGGQVYVLDDDQLLMIAP
jgi:hypothetical protein